MNILQYRTHPNLALCPRAYLATGTIRQDVFNRKLLKKNQTGNWLVAPGRVRQGDAFFLLLPNVAAKDGYPRELHAGIVSQVFEIVDRTRFTVNEFLELDPIKSEVKNFLVGKTPPMGSRILEIWSDKDDFDVRFASAVNKALNDTVARRRARLAKASPIASRIAVLTEKFNRNPDVVAEVLFQAKGRCGQCKETAPFIRRSDKSPYLEVHHKVQLAFGGEDTVNNAIALCPNCHRELHHG